MSDDLIVNGEAIELSDEILDTVIGGTNFPTNTLEQNVASIGGGPIINFGTISINQTNVNIQIEQVFLDCGENKSHHHSKSKHYKHPTLWDFLNNML